MNLYAGTIKIGFETTANIETEIEWFFTNIPANNSEMSKQFFETAVI